MNPIAQQLLDYLSTQFAATQGHRRIMELLEALDKPAVPAEVGEDRPHHPYSPSTLQSREWCPCFENKQQKKVHERTTAGTRAHGVVETGEDDNRLTDDDAAAAAECLDFVDSRRRLMDDDGHRAWAEAADHAGHVDSQPSPDEYKTTELKEIKLAVDDLKFPDCDATTSGYVDRVLISWDKKYAELFDWKFGMWPVEGAESNLQGIAYTLGLFREYPTLQRVRFFFKQPHLGVTSDCTFERADIPKHYLRIQVVVARARRAKEAKARGDFGEAKPAVPLCNFCAELGRCPKVTEFACVVGHKFYPLEVPDEVTPSLIQDPKNTARGMSLCSVLKVWCDAFRRQVTDRVLRGDAPLPTGQRIQEKSNREIVDQARFRTVALRYLTEAEWQSTLDTSFGSVEELISDHAPRGQKEATVRAFQKELLDSGAVKMGEKFSFLRAVAEKGK